MVYNFVLLISRHLFPCGKHWRYFMPLVNICNTLRRLFFGRVAELWRFPCQCFWDAGGRFRSWAPSPIEVGHPPQLKLVALLSEYKVVLVLEISEAGTCTSLVCFWLCDLLRLVGNRYCSGACFGRNIKSDENYQAVGWNRLDQIHLSYQE